MARKGLCDHQLCHMVTNKPHPQVPHPHIFWTLSGMRIAWYARAWQCQNLAVTVSPIWGLQRLPLPCAQGFVSPQQAQPGSQREHLFWEQQPQEQLV